MAEKYLFKLYHSGQLSFNGTIPKLKNIFNEKFKDQYFLEIINVTEHPELAVRLKILMTPTLIKELPLPSVAVAGNFSDIKNLSTAVDISVK